MFSKLASVFMFTLPSLAYAHPGHDHHWSEQAINGSLIAAGIGVAAIAFLIIKNWQK